MSSESNKLQEIYEYVIELTKGCGVVFREGFFIETEAQTKGKYYDLVTKYDNDIEAILIDGLKLKYPSHKFIGEETANLVGLTLTDDPTWIIDPIDGTTNFVGGFPQAAISIALAINRELVIGIIYNPILNEFYRALKGHGAFMNDVKISASHVDDFSKSIIGYEVGMYHHERCRDKVFYRFDKICRICRGVRCIGSAALQMAYVANGYLDGFQVDDLKPWDIAAGAVLVREAGGVVYAPDGSEFNVMKPNVVCAGTEALCQRFIELVKYDETK